MEKPQKFIVAIVLTFGPMLFTPILNVPSPGPDGGKDVLNQKHTPVPPLVVAIGAVMFVGGVLLGGKLLLDHMVPPQGESTPTSPSP